VSLATDCNPLLTQNDPETITRNGRKKNLGDQIKAAGGPELDGYRIVILELGYGGRSGPGQTKPGLNFPGSSGAGRADVA
jgi:hypothetical protein